MGWKACTTNIAAMKFFINFHALHVDPSSLCRFHHRTSEMGPELVLQVAVQAGLASGADKAIGFERVTVDTTRLCRKMCGRLSHGCTFVQPQP